MFAVVFPSLSRNDNVDVRRPLKFLRNYYVSGTKFIFPHQQLKFRVGKICSIIKTQKEFFFSLKIIELFKIVSCVEET